MTSSPAQHAESLRGSQSRSKWNVDPTNESDDDGIRTDKYLRRNPGDSGEVPMDDTVYLDSSGAFSVQVYQTWSELWVDKERKKGSLKILRAGNEETS